MYRTHNCNELRIGNIGEEVTIAGFVSKIRNYGGLTFIDIRDHYGITQVVIRDEKLIEIQNKLSESSVRKYFKCQGNYDFADGNGITLQHYLKLFAGYDTSHIVPEEKPKI